MPPPVFIPDRPPRAAIIAVASPLNAAAIARHDMKSSIFCFSKGTFFVMFLFFFTRTTGYLWRNYSTYEYKKEGT
jgi:hypothetical protein